MRRVGVRIMTSEILGSGDGVILLCNILVLYIYLLNKFYVYFIIGIQVPRLIAMTRNR